MLQLIFQFIQLFIVKYIPHARNGLENFQFFISLVHIAWEKNIWDPVIFMMMRIILTNFSQCKHVSPRCFKCSHSRSMFVQRPPRASKVNSSAGRASWLHERRKKFEDFQHCRPINNDGHEWTSWVSEMYQIRG